MKRLMAERGWHAEHLPQLQGRVRRNHRLAGDNLVDRLKGTPRALGEFGLGRVKSFQGLGQRLPRGDREVRFKCRVHTSFNVCL